MMRSQQPRTVISDKPLPPPVPPKPSQSGLPDDFDFDTYDAWARRRSNIQVGIAWMLVIGLGLLYFGWASVGFTEVNEWVGLAIFPFLGMAFSGGTVASLIIINFAMPDPWERYVTSHRRAIRRYEDAKQDWEDRRLETGLTYWREMRGIAFERAVKEFLSRRGAKVEMTKGSGDGGIDLIVTLGDTVYWCQCKGHAAPISVAPIREVAGVCSRGGGKPIVFAVNGYTKSAISTAEQLGVRLFDAHHFVKLAEAVRLGEISPSVR